MISPCSGRGESCQEGRRLPRERIMKATNPVYTGLETTIFEVMSRLAVQHEAINLGQGFPDVDGPEDIRQFAADLLIKGPNQYPPMMGSPELRQEVARTAKRFYGLDIDWQTEVMVTSGGTEALGDCILALVNPGDEVIVIEPLYDSYVPMIVRSGGTPVRVGIKPPEWKLDLAALEAAFGPKTKAVIINNPMNPAGKVFTDEELSGLAKLCVEHDVVAICDEVYEHLTFDGIRHHPLMTFPGMRERSLRIGSAGKTFSMTGWKVGYITGAPKVLDPVAKAHQFITFTTPPALQKAVAFGLAKDDSYYVELASSLQGKRDRFMKGLADLGFGVMPCQGTFFLTCNIDPLGLEGNDVDICQRMVEEAGVAAVPVSAFYGREGEDVPRNLLRFCFCKRDEILDEALARLGKWLKNVR